MFLRMTGMRTINADAAKTDMFVGIYVSSHPTKINVLTMWRSWNGDYGKESNKGD